MFHAPRPCSAGNPLVCVNKKGSGRMHTAVMFAVRQCVVQWSTLITLKHLHNSFSQTKRNPLPQHPIRWATGSYFCLERRVRVNQKLQVHVCFRPLFRAEVEPTYLFKESYRALSYRTSSASESVCPIFRANVGPNCQPCPVLFKFRLIP